MLSVKSVCVLTESRLWADGFCTPRFLMYFLLFCYNQEGALTSAHRDQEGQSAILTLNLNHEHDLIQHPILIKQ